MSLTSIQSTPSAGQNTTTGGVSTNTPSVTTATETTTAPASVSSAASASLVGTAVNLASEASIVSILGGNQTSATTYTAAGLLSAFNSAGQAPSSSSTTATTNSSATSSSTSQNTTQANSQLAEDKIIVSNINNGTTSQINPNAALYSAISAFNGTNNQSDLSSQWAAALKNNPSAVATLDQDNLNQQIVSTISINV